MIATHIFPADSGRLHTSTAALTMASTDTPTGSPIIHNSQDGLALLTIIKTITYNFEERRNLVDVLCDVKQNFYTLRQGQYQSLQRHFENFDRLRAVLDEVGIDIVDPALLTRVAANNHHMIPIPTDDDHEEAKEMALAIRFIRSTTNAAHKGYLKELRHNILNAHDDYPKTLSDAYNILHRREPDLASVVHHEGVAFVTAGRVRRTHAHIKCNRCEKDGHYANPNVHLVLPRQEEQNIEEQYREGAQLSFFETKGGVWYHHIRGIWRAMAAECVCHPAGTRTPNVHMYLHAVQYYCK